MSEGLTRTVLQIPCRYIDTTSDYNRNTVIEIECKTADKFIETLRKISQHCALNLFRGHRDAEWQMLPTAHREDSWIGQLVSKNIVDGYQRFTRYRWLDETDEKFERRIDLALRSFYQTRMIAAYDEVAKEWGITIDLISESDRDDASQKLTPYERLTFCMASQWIPPFDTSDLYSQIIAQHHGVLTPFLDFSSSFEVAADFASREACDNGQSHIAVLAIADSPPFNLYHAFGVESPYLQQQKSYMLLNSCADLTFYESGKWIPFETRLSNTMPLGSVFKITLPYSEVESLRTRLSVLRTPLYMMGTPMYESVQAVQRRIDCRRQSSAETSDVE